MNRRQRGILADAALGAGATLLLLFSTANASGGKIPLFAGIALIVLGLVLLWGVPRPDLRTRLLASVAGLFVGFGAAIVGLGNGAWYSLGAGALLLLSLYAMAARGPPD